MVTIVATTTVPYDPLSHFPLTGGFAAGEWEMGKRMREVALHVAANVRLPRTSRGHPPRLVRVNQATQETAELCPFSPAELVRGMPNIAIATINASLIEK